MVFPRLYPSLSLGDNGTVLATVGLGLSRSGVGTDGVEGVAPGVVAPGVVAPGIVAPGVVRGSWERGVPAAPDGEPATVASCDFSSCPNILRTASHMYKSPSVVSH